jgi:hypothetical protein
LGAAVQGVRLDGRLCIDFADGRTLALKIAANGFESLVVDQPGGAVIVF